MSKIFPNPRSKSHLTAVKFTVILSLAGTFPSAHAQWGALFQAAAQMAAATPPPAPPPLSTEEARLASGIPTKVWDAKTMTPVSDNDSTQAKLFANSVTTNMRDAAELRSLLERLHIEGERNATLNLQRVGLAAIHAGELKLAERTLDAATSRIEMIYADNAEAQKAKSLWTAEKIKDFKGEPYERAMAHYYRGLVYAARGDFQNARAMFKQAEYQDTVAENEKFSGDFGLMPYMAGWSSYCDGNTQLAKDYLEQAAKGDSNYLSVAVDKPVLVLFETGRAPFKYGDGKFREQLKFENHSAFNSPVSKVCETNNNCTTNNIVLGADIGFQATTRGGRPVDAILNGKASFKDGAQDAAKIANTASQIGFQVAAITGNRDMRNLGLFGMFAGMVAQGASNATQAQADIREWDQLPNNIWLSTKDYKSSNASVSVSLASGTTHVAKRIVNTPSCQLYLGRDEFKTVYATEAGPTDGGKHPKDSIFRKEIEGLLIGM